MGGRSAERHPRRRQPSRLSSRAWADGSFASTADDKRGLQERIRDLEGRVRALAVSRRVLITLLVSADRKRKVEVARLRAEVERLRSQARKKTRAISARDAVIHRLRSRMVELVGPDALALDAGRSVEDKVEEQRPRFLSLVRARTGDKGDDRP